MTYSLTRTEAFTITDARQIASKMGADLRNLFARTGHPAEADIPDYVEEAAAYLKSGYLKDVAYGFRDGDRWVLRLRYEALAGGHLSDGAPGGLPNVDVAGYAFHSYLRTNAAFADLAPADQRAFEDTLPVQRTPGAEPTASGGKSANTTTYARHGVGLGRDVYRAT